MSDLQKLDNIGKRNGDIKAFATNTNIVSANTGKDNYGNITIAIDNESVHRLMNDELVGLLILTTREEWEREEG